MDNTNINTPQRDEKLWKLAKRRASFKKHLVSYILVNAFLWLIWFIGHYSEGDSFNWGFGMHNGFHVPWPVFVSFFWGIGLVFEFFHTYVTNHEDLIDKEYQKLVNKKG